MAALNFNRLAISTIAAIFLLSLHSINAQPWDYPTATLSTTWVNSVTANHSVAFTDGSLVRAILLRGKLGPRYACGFFCDGTCENYLFAIFIVQTNSVSFIVQPSIGFPQVVWAANRDRPVKINATLQLTSEGDLVLRDADGTLAWSTNTKGKSVSGVSLTESGNLVLLDAKKNVVWNSFDHPTDALVPGQKLVTGQKLTSDGGLFSVLVNNGGLFAYINSNPPQSYYQNSVSGTKYVQLQNGSLAIYPNSFISLPLASSAQYLKLGSDGHFILYEWNSGWKQVSDLFTGFLGECNYPNVCGKNGICSKGQCSCPTSYFKAINPRQPDLGCSEITPLKCSGLKNQGFLEVQDATYFTFNADISNTNANNCKQSCLKKCECKAAIFRWGSDSSKGECYLPSEVFSVMNNEKDKTHYNSTVFMKVQKK